MRVPKGQTSVFYNVDAALQDSKRQAAEQAAEQAADGAAAAATAETEESSTKKEGAATESSR